MGEQIVFALEMLINQRLGRAGFAGDLNGGGAVETLNGEKPRCGFQDCISFAHRNIICNLDGFD